MIVRGAPAIGQVAAIGLALTAEQGPDDAAVRPPGDAARRAPTRSSTPGPPRSTCAGRSTGSWPRTRRSATCPRTATPSPTRCAPRPTRSSSRRPRTTAGWRRSAWRRSTFPEDRPLRILTHCNTGPLACGQFGTALGVVQAAHHAGRAVHVWVDETRPYLQGARLTAWELAQAGVPHTLIPDVAAGHLMASGEVDVVIVGADRIAANGDTANKVGTYTLAVLAARHGIPFYVAAPISTVDLATPDGARHPDRGAQGERGPVRPRRAHRAARHRGAQPGVRRDAGRADHRASSPTRACSGRRTPRAWRRRSRDASGGAPRRPGSRPLAGARAAVPAAPSRRRCADACHGQRSSDGAVAIGRAAASPARRPTARCSARSSAQDRLYAAYAICDLEEREFGADPLGRRLRRRRARRGRPRVHRPDAAAAVRDGPPRRHQRRPARRHPAARRVHRRPHDDAARGRGPLPRRPGPADGPDVGRPGALPAVSGDRPAAAARSRSASSTGSTSSGSPRGCRRAPSPTASTTGCASTASSWLRPARTSSARRRGSRSSATS